MPEILLANVDEDLYRSLRKKAKARGVDLIELMMEALRREVHIPSSEAPADVAVVVDSNGDDEGRVGSAPPPDDWIDPLEAKFGNDPEVRWLLEFRRKNWDGLMTDEESDNFQRIIKDKPPQLPKVEKRPPPEGWVDPLASVDRDDEAFMWLLKFRREHWNGLRTPEEYETFVEATKRTDVGGPGIYEAE